VSVAVAGWRPSVGVEREAEGQGGARGRGPKVQGGGDRRGEHRERGVRGKGEGDSG
jgi:hypothetical protein